MKQLYDYLNDSWFSYLTPDLQALVRLCLELWSREKENSTQFYDYAFILFPLSKAYEGFLKKCLFDLKLLTKDEYLSKRFRIGRALNPDIRFRYQDESWLYDDLARRCGDEAARRVWNTWLESRNRIFHYFPQYTHQMSFGEVEKHITSVLGTMQILAQSVLSSQQK